MATLTVTFLEDGSVKLEVTGQVDVTVHDAVAADLDALHRLLGGDVTTEALDAEHAGLHRHGVSHVHAGGGHRR